MGELTLLDKFSALCTYVFLLVRKKGLVQAAIPVSGVWLLLGNLVDILGGFLCLFTSMANSYDLPSVFSPLDIVSMPTGCIQSTISFLCHCQY